MRVRSAVGSVPRWGLLSCLLAAPASALGPRAACPSCEADFALYDPRTPGAGVWEKEAAALMKALRRFGWTYQEVGFAEINRGILGSGAARRYRAVIFPGGDALGPSADITPAGKANLEEFVAKGGNYVGFCAGSYFAAKRLIWAEKATGGGGRYNRPRDYGAYPGARLNLFPGRTEGPFGWVPWRHETGSSVETVAVNLNNPVMRKIGLPARIKIFYFGGPFFDFDRPPSDDEVWARAVAPWGTSAAASVGAGAPSIVRFSHGKGTVILFSYHPSVIPPGAGRALKYQSRNILHAALQIAADEPVSPL